MSSNSTKVYHKAGINGGDDLFVASGGTVQIEDGGAIGIASGGAISIVSGGLFVSQGSMTLLSGGDLSFSAGSTLTGNVASECWTSPVINVDNGAGTTLDIACFNLPYAITITSAKVIYTTETTGAIGAATVQLGSTLTGTQIVAATALEASKAVGTTTALTLTTGALAATTTLFLRHTGVVATPLAGEYVVQVVYTKTN